VCGLHIGGCASKAKLGVWSAFKRAKRFGFTDTVYDLNGLREHADEFLFNQIQSDFHCLHFTAY
jgi:hypothetical protein